MDKRDDKLPLHGFRNSPWRYSQFVGVGLAVSVLVHWLAGTTWPVAFGIGAVVAAAYLVLEKKRGVI